jgi:hypothetical protein
VEVQHHAGAGRASCRERARAERRLHVVHVHHVRAQIARRRRHLVLGGAAAQQRRRGLRAADVGRATLEQPVLDAGIGERPELERDGALLAPLVAVAVVQQQDAGLAAHRAGLRYRPRWTRPWCQSWSPRAAARRTSR